MTSNSKKPRRWINVRNNQHSITYRLDCKVSDRQAFVEAKGRPFTWAIYGFPNESGHAHQWGNAKTLTGAKIAARIALDDMADYSEWITRQPSAVAPR